MPLFLLDHTSLSHSRKIDATRTAIDKLIDRPVADKGYVVFVSYLYSVVYGYQPNIEKCEDKEEKILVVRDVKDSQR